MKNGKKCAIGSLTVEAALVLPIFLFSALSIMYINKLILYEEKVQWALTRVAREASVEYAAVGDSLVVNPVYLTAKMKRYVDEDGLLVQMFRSRFDPKTDELDLIADYHITIPFPIPVQRKISFTEQIHTRAFTGVETRLEESEEGETIVYIAKTGTVYHRKLSCTYLTLSISQVNYGDLVHLRSEGGGKYYACKSCCRGKECSGGQSVFICNYGDRFHSYRACKKIKRSIQEIKLSEAGGRLPCSKCGKE